MNIKQLVSVAEATVLTTVASFLAAVAQIPGASFDGKHLAAAGIGALTAFAYKMSGVINGFVGATEPAPAAPSPVLQPSTPQIPAPTPPVAS